MTKQSREILEKYQVRKSAKEKRAFRAWLREQLEGAGWQTAEEGSFFSGRNVIAGDPDRAEVFFTAHYDTQAVLPFPNFITPQSMGWYVVCQMPLVVAMFAIIAIFIAVGALLGGWLLPDADPAMVKPVSLYPGLFFCMWWMSFGAANKHTVNDNTSGVLTLLETALALPEADRDKVCIIFFDNEERGMLGSANFASKHKAVKEKGLILNFDCVSDGDFIQFYPTKELKKEETVLAMLEETYPSRASKEVSVVRSFGFYPSDNASFKRACGVCALKKSKTLGYYMDRIHTPRDTVLMEENIELLRDGNLSLAAALSGEKEA